MRSKRISGGLHGCTQPGCGTQFCYKLGPDLRHAILSAAQRHGVSERQVVLAWLLTRSPQMLPIPGSGSPEHVEQNIAAASIDLWPDEIKAITRATRGWSSPR